jgi:hypothetical protein
MYCWLNSLTSNYTVNTYTNIEYIHTHTNTQVIEKDTQQEFSRLKGAEPRVHPLIRASIYAQCNIPVPLALLTLPSVKKSVSGFSHYVRTGIKTVPYVNPETGPFEFRSDNSSDQLNLLKTKRNLLYTGISPYRAVKTLSTTVIKIS